MQGVWYFLAKPACVSSLRLLSFSSLSFLPPTHPHSLPTRPPWLGALVPQHHFPAHTCLAQQALLSAGCLQSLSLVGSHMHRQMQRVPICCSLRLTDKWRLHAVKTFLTWVYLFYLCSKDCAVDTIVCIPVGPRKGVPRICES